MSAHDRRGSERIPTSQPVAVALGDVVASETRYLNNISEGGLAFDSLTQLDLGVTIHIGLPVVRPLITLSGQVVWCKPDGVKFEVGVQFVGADVEMRRRMVALARHIDDYRARVSASGRMLDPQEAALEWLAKFGATFFGEDRAATG